MANRYDWNAVQEREAQNAARAQQSGNYVGYFSLKNDKDEAIVRIMHDSPDDFDFVPVHPVTDAGKFANVGCLRGPNDPLDMCPLCEAGKRFSLRMYIHLIQYVTDDNGQIQPVAKVWDRSSSYGKTLVNYMNEYGPLSDVIFKIKRNGAAGSQDTTYDIMPASTKIYTDDRYPKVPELFGEYTALGNAVRIKSYEEMMAYVGPEDAATVSAPVKNVPFNNYTPKTAPATPAFSAPAYNAPKAQPVAEEQPMMPEVKPTYNAPTYGTPRATGFQGSENTGAARPRRIY